MADTITKGMVRVKDYFGIGARIHPDFIYCIKYAEKMGQGRAWEVYCIGCEETPLLVNDKVLQEILKLAERP